MPLTTFCSSERPCLVPRALEVEKGKLCYIIGTIYMDMPLKPNVMDDIARDVSSIISLSSNAL